MDRAEFVAAAFCATLTVLLLVVGGSCAHSSAPAAVQVDPTSGREGCECFSEVCAVRGESRQCVYFTRACTEGQIDLCVSRNRPGHHRRHPDAGEDETPDIPESVPIPNSLPM